MVISACLLGQPCRYDGASVPCAQVIAYAQCHEVVPLCPEQLGGLPTPRTPSELGGDGRVVDAAGADRTEAFRKGAAAAVDLALLNGCTQAILKSRSPSCGVHEIHDGTFSGALVEGRGVAAAALAAAGIAVYDETEADKWK